MRSVRCDACGNKALIAASQCPKCGHLFEVRDGFGDLLPLSFCATCESYYPESVGSCRWCGTKPEPPPISPLVWKRVGIGALVALVGVAWLMRDTAPKRGDEARSTAARKPDSTSTAAPVAPTAPAASTAPVIAIGPGDSQPSRVQLAGNAGVDRSQAPAPDAPSPVNDSLGPIAIPPASVPAGSSVKTATPASSKAGSSARWVNSISKDWVVVRAGPSKASRLIASIGPKSRVQLGESRGTWRRIKARGIAGWVEPRELFAAAPASRSGVLVSR